MAEHGAEPHARLLVTGDGKCHDRKIQHEEGCDQLDVVFHDDNLDDRRHDRGLSVRSATRRQSQQQIVVVPFAGTGITAGTPKSLSFEILAIDGRAWCVVPFDLRGTVPWFAASGFSNDEHVVQRFDIVQG